MGERLWLDLSFLLDSVHVDAITEALVSTMPEMEMFKVAGQTSDLQCSDVGTQSGETDIQSVGHREDLVNGEQWEDWMNCQTSTLWKLDEMPKAWVPKRRSEAMATQSLPTMATTEPPLYSKAD